MEDAKCNAQYYDDEEDKFHDAHDDFLFNDCGFFVERSKSNDGGSTSFSNTNSPMEDETLTSAALQYRRSISHRMSSSKDSMEQSSVSLENCLERELRLSHRIKENEKKLDDENSGTLELEYNLGGKDIAGGENIEKNEDSSTLVRGELVEKNEVNSVSADANFNNGGEDLVRKELVLKENHEASSSFLWTLAGLMIKVITFLVNLLVKIFMFPIWLFYYLFMFVFNPLGLCKCCRRRIVQKLRRVWSIVLPFVYEWLKEHSGVWKMGLKCSWGLMWFVYACMVLVGLLVSSFMIGGLLIKMVVEKPLTMKSNLNFDYTERSPVAYVPIIACPSTSHDIYLEKMPEIGKSSGLRVIPPNHKVQVIVSLTLPDSDYNQNLGIFQVKVDFLANDGKILASSRHPCMLQYRSQPIRLLLTLLKIAPILTGYTSETQNLKIKFQGFTEDDASTSCLRVVIEQRAEFPPGAGGIPEIYTSSLLLESELPLLRRVVWFWRTPLFVWISLMIYIMELVFALACCKPFIIPKLRLREAI